MNDFLSAKLEDYSIQAANNAIFLTTPEVVAEFCTEQYGNLRFGRKDGRYLRQNLIGRQVCLDLNEGYKSREVGGSAFKSMMNRRDRLFKDKAMEQTMEWILKTAEEQDRRVKEVTRNAEFVTTQGALSKIACSVYDYEHWLDRGVSLTVQKFDDIIFLSESNVTQSSSGSQFQEDDYARRVRHWNKKFAQYICSDKTAGDQGTSMPMNVGKVKSIVVSQVCAEEISFSVIYRSEIDCFDADGDDVVVLGTQFDSIGNGKYFCRKAFRWLLQSYLAGSKSIVVGIRNNEGFVHRVQKLTPEDLLQHTKDLKLAPCLSLLHSFLASVKRKMATLDNGVVLLVKRLPKSSLFSFAIIDENSDDYEFYNFVCEEFNGLCS